MPRIALRLAYDGTGYCGWQTQHSRESLQDALEFALASIALEPVKVVCAGRTDTGVHALSQLVHFDTEADRPLRAWVKGANQFLLQQHAAKSSAGAGRIMVQHAQIVSEDFHARFSALARRYFYVIYNHESWHPHWVNRAGFWYRKIDLTVMRQAAAVLIGRHDFSAFRAAECQARSPIRTIQCLNIRHDPPFVVVEVQADGFLHHMIRNMVGALLSIACGDEPVQRISDWLAAADRRALPPTFAACGLYFAGALYPPGALGFPTLSDIDEILPGLS